MTVDYILITLGLSRTSYENILSPNPIITELVVASKSVTNSTFKSEVDDMLSNDLGTYILIHFENINGEPDNEAVMNYYNYLRDVLARFDDSQNVLPLSSTLVSIKFYILALLPLFCISPPK